MEVQQQPGERFEGLLRRFGRTIIKAGILGEAKRQRHSLSKGEAKRAKQPTGAHRLFLALPRRPIRLRHGLPPWHDVARHERRAPGRLPRRGRGEE